MSKWLYYIVTLVLLMVAQAPLKAQRMAVTTNLLEDVVATPNLGVDIVLADRQSVAFDVSFAPYKLTKNFYNKQMTFRAGYKFWLNQAFYAQYISIDAVASSSDTQIGKLGARDQSLGLGVGYGYSYIINKRLNIVPHIGLGVAYGATYEGADQMIKPNEGVQATSTSGFRPMITRLGLTLQYVLR